MPTYDYICTACGHQMEVVHGIHGHGPEACPVCGGVMRKGFAAPAVHFKGSGWAKKDRGAAARTKAAAKTGGVRNYFVEMELREMKLSYDYLHRLAG